MKKAKRILALLLAVVMLASVFSTTGMAKIAAGDYTSYKTNPNAYFNSIQKIEFTPEQGACWLLDYLDQLLYDVNFAYDGEKLVDETLYKVTVWAYLRNIDEALWTLYNAVKGLKDSNETCLRNILKVEGPLGMNVSNLLDNVVSSSDIGDLRNLNYSALGDQNSDARVTRANPGRDTTGGHAGVPNGAPDLTVLCMLLQFLSDNRDTLAKIGDGSIDLVITLKIMGITITHLDIPGMLPESASLFLTDLPKALKNTLYSALWNSTADEAPSNFNYDTGIQQLVNWLLIDGTGESGSDGGKSILGSNFEPFLPAIANYPGGASVFNEQIQADRGEGVQTYNMNVYQLVNNALNALLSGYVSDLLYGLLIDLLDIDDSDGLGDPSIMTDLVFSLVVGIIKDLFETCGAPELIYTDAGENYPVPRIRELLDWLFNGGALETFIRVDYSGISLTDNFIQLLRDLLRLLPGLVPMLGIEYPEGLIHTTAELTENLYMDLTIDGELVEHVPIYTTYDGDFIFYPDSSDKSYAEYVESRQAVNMSDSSAASYVNPTFIREAYVIPESAVWADILKVLLNSFIDGCYFPEWADTIAEVGAYALASLAAAYLPQNNYFDRLDAYHYIVEEGGTYQPIGTATAVTPLAYTEEVYISGLNTTVTVPRAAADIGASLGAFFLNGAFPMDTLGFWPETDTNFETYLSEFLVWAATEYLEVFTGHWNTITGRYENLGTYGSTTVAGTWQTQFNTFVTQFNALRSQYPSTDYGTFTVCNIPASAMRELIYPLIDNTVLGLVPANWLPSWLAAGGSSALFNYWLGDSLIDIDLQQIVSLLSINPDGELGQNGLIKVVLNLLDRVLGALLGGNAVLPPSTQSISTNRNVFTTPTSLTGLEAFLGSGAQLRNFISNLFYYLGIYGKPLLSTALPIIMNITQDVVKSTTYREVGTTTTVDYLENKTITLDDLQDYIDEYGGNKNQIIFDQSVPYNNAQIATMVAQDIGVSDNLITYSDGQYYVPFPNAYTRLSFAEKAASHASDYLKKAEDAGEDVLGTECVVTRKTENGQRIYFVEQKLDYRAATATLTKSYVYDTDNVTVLETIYNYSNFSKASTTVRDVNNNGKVTYGSGYVLYDREDYASDKISYLNRRNNAVEDASDFISKYNGYIQTLCDSYGRWMNYLINLQLKNANLYDKNDDGVVNSDDGFPGQPDDSVPYPFYRASGSSSVSFWDTTTTYNFNYAATSGIVQAAFDYANEDVYDEDNVYVGNHDVTLDLGETESVVRLALNSINFDITKDEEGNYNSGSKQWEDLTAADKTAITNKCNSLGYTYHPDDNEITRKAFNYFTGSAVGGYSSFGTFTDDKGTSTTINFAPLSAYNSTGEGDGVARLNNLQKSYITFAKGIREYDAGIKEHYDDISWRAAHSEGNMLTSYKINSLEWVLNYTKSAYYPIGEQNGRNKRYNTVTGGLESAYSKSTYTEFQKAYDYAAALKDFISSGGYGISQSLVSVAYRNVINAYNRLVPFSGVADWAELLANLQAAYTALNSEIGLNQDGTVKDPVYGYTLQSLLDLRDVAQDAQSLYDEFALSYDSDYQSIIDEESTLVWNALQNLAFNVGTIPDIIISSTYDGPVDKITYKPTDSTDIRTLGVIIGFAEGAGLTADHIEQGIFVTTGYRLDATLGNEFAYQPSGRGSGTGSELIGKIGNQPRFEYYCAIIGDLNGDSRIDGNDKAIVDSMLAQDNVEDQLTYLQIAADVDQSGTIDATDINIIKAHYRYETYGDIDGTINQTSINPSWYNN